MMTGIEEARGDYVLTLDADQSHDPDFVVKMWRARKRADIVVASRYVLGGVAYSDFIRRSTSWFLNQALRRIRGSKPVSREKIAHPADGSRHFSHSCAAETENEAVANIFPEVAPGKRGEPDGGGFHRRLLVEVG